MSESDTRIGRLALPAALLRAIEDGRWRPPQRQQALVEVFGDQPDGPHFYDVATMARQNLTFQTKSQTELAEVVFGSDRGLGIEPSLAVLIGDLGADMPIALDYRTNTDSPRVLYLGQDGWLEIAPDFEALSRALGL